MSVPCRIGRLLIGNFVGLGSRGPCFGKNIARPIPLGFGYAWFCEHYEAWRGRVRPTVRQSHVGGEKVFVDFAGDTIEVIDPASGEVRAMKLFVAAMSASNYTYAGAVATEGLEDWIGVHVRMFAFLGGVPKVVVPDNLKAAVLRVARYDPGLNRT